LQAEFKFYLLLTSGFIEEEVKNTGRFPAGIDEVFMFCLFVIIFSKKVISYTIKMVFLQCLNDFI